MRRTGKLGVALGVAIYTSALAGAGMAADRLEPYQLVRSLQLVQDRIASGDHAALPMQGKLLEMVDARLRVATQDDFKAAKNFRALLVYGMSGGNPVTVDAALARMQLDPQDRRIANGIIDYLSGRPAAATEALKPVDPMMLPPDIGAFLALVKGSLLAAEHPVEALALLDQARLLSPGTLVEEAALRRSVAIAATRGDASRFALASTQYVENYLYSPYASQFADAFVSGVITLHEAISQDKLGDITAMMDAEREKVIYLRIARRAAIDGLNELSAFASARAEQGRDGKRNEDDPRALLYASLSTVTSATVESLRTTLGKIDRSQLSEGDQALLDAAKTVARGLVAPPLAPPAVGRITPEFKKPAVADAIEQVPDGSGLPPLEGAMPDQSTAAPMAAPVAVAVPASPEAAPTDTVAAADPTDTAIADVRRKLSAIDQMLGVSPK